MRKLLLLFLLLWAIPVFGQGTQIQSGPVDPSLCKAGAFFYNTTSTLYKQCSPGGNAWTTIAGGGGTPPAGNPNDTQINGGGGLFGAVANGYTGQIYTSANGAAPSFLSPSLADGNSGSPVTGASYTIQCDSATTIIDRAHTLRFQSGAATVTIPLSSASGCTGGFWTMVVDESAGSLVFNASGADSLNVYNGENSTIGVPSFTLANGQFATLVQGATGLWEVFLGGPVATPVGNNGDLQMKNGTFFAPSHINDNGVKVLINEDVAFNGSNPGIDIRAFGARAVPSGSVASASATCTSGLPTLTVGSGFNGFSTGDWVVVYGCGTSTVNTPASPTVTASVEAGPTMTGLTVAGPTGATQYCYQILSRTFLGGTSVGSEVCTATGPTTLGEQNVAISGATLANNVATYTTSSAHGLVVGAKIRVTGVFAAAYSGVGQFSGHFTVHTVPDNTHFTVILNADTRAGHPTTGGAGTVYWWNANHIAAAATTNNFEYYIYGRVTGGSKTLIGIMKPQPFGTTCASMFTFGDQGTCLTFDDFGSSVVNATPSAPSYIPATVPSAGTTNDMLLGRITSGGGTANVTLSVNAGNSTTGTMLLDSASQAFIAAWNSSATAQAPIIIPSSPSGTQWIFNAPVQVVNQGNQRIVVSQAGNVYINEPIVFSTDAKWGGIAGGGQVSPGFSQQVQPQIFIKNASPGIYAVSGNAMFMDNIAIQLLGTGQVGFQQDNGGIPTSRFSNVSLNIAPATVSDIAMGFRGGGADVQMSNITAIASQAGAYTADTPIIDFNQLGNVSFDWLYMSGQGISILPNQQGAGTYLMANNVYCQACYMPLFAFGPNPGPLFGRIDNVTLDTGFDNIITSNYGGGKLYLTGSANGLGSVGGFTGIGVSSGNGSSQTMEESGIPYPTPNANNGIVGYEEHNALYYMRDGTFGAATMPVDSYFKSQKIAPGFSVYTDSAPPAAPSSCSAASGGSFAVGTYLLIYAPLYAASGSGEGRWSASCSITTSSGNQTLTGTAPALPGVSGYEWYWSSNSGVSWNACSFGNPVSIPSSGTCAGQGGGTAMPASGPAGMHDDTQWAQKLWIGLTQMTSTATANRGVILPDDAGYVPVTGLDLSSYDNFNRSTLNTSGPCSGGSCWTTNGITPTIVGNQITSGAATAGQYSAGFWKAANNTAPYSGDQSVAIRVVSFGTGAGMLPMVRYSTGNSAGYACATNIVRWNIGSFTQSALTSGGTGSTPVVAGDIVRLDAIGSNPTTLNCYHNGILVATGTDGTASNQSGQPGFVSTDASNVSDNWQASFPHGILQDDQEFSTDEPVHFLSLAAGYPTTAPGTLANGGIYSSLWAASSGLCTDTDGKAITSGCAAGSISGLTSGQVAIAGGATSITSSKALQGTDTSVMSAGTVSGTAATLCTDANGGATTVGCTGGSISGLTTGQVPIAGSASSLTSSKALQGTDANVLTSSTIAGGAGNILCTDTGSGATTSNCPAVVTMVYNTQSSAVTTNISATNMVASTSALHAYTFGWTISLTVVGTGCSSSTTVNMNAVFTDPNTSSPVTELLGIITIAAGGNGTVGFVAQGSDNIVAKSGTAVQYSTTGYTAGTGCSVNPTYQVSPTLVQLW